MKKKENKKNMYILKKKRTQDAQTYKYKQRREKKEGKKSGKTKEKRE